MDLQLCRGCSQSHHGGDHVGNCQTFASEYCNSRIRAPVALIILASTLLIRSFGHKSKALLLAWRENSQEGGLLVFPSKRFVSMSLACHRTGPPALTGGWFSIPNAESSKAGWFFVRLRSNWVKMDKIECELSSNIGSNMHYRYTK